MSEGPPVIVIMMVDDNISTDLELNLSLSGTAREGDCQTNCSDQVEDEAQYFYQ